MVRRSLLLDPRTEYKHRVIWYSVFHLHSSWQSCLLFLWILLCASWTQGNSFNTASPGSSTVWTQLLRRTERPLSLSGLCYLWRLLEGWGTRLLRSQLPQIHLPFLLSFPTAPSRPSQLRQARHRPAFWGSCLMTFITSSQSIRDVPPPSKAGHLHFDSRVGELSLMHKVFLFFFCVL